LYLLSYNRYLELEKWQMSLFRMTNVIFSVAGFFMMTFVN
jgi:hypothetical protein